MRMASHRPPQLVPDHHEKRRSHRLLLQVTVRVRGKDVQQQLFLEEAQTLVVNAHGGLITLAAEIRVGDKIVLMNKGTDEQETAAVVFIGPLMDGKREVGFEFERAAGHFWGVAFPPADWTPANQAPPEP
jgi:hypothetical protein